MSNIEPAAFQQSMIEVAVTNHVEKLRWIKTLDPSLLISTLFDLFDTSNLTSKKGGVPHIFNSLPMALLWLPG
jgi:hypothetical protein